MAGRDCQQEGAVTCWQICRSSPFGERVVFQAGFLLLPSWSCRNSCGSLGKEGRKGKGRKSWKWLPRALLLSSLIARRQCEAPCSNPWPPGTPTLLSLLHGSWSSGACPQPDSAATAVEVSGQLEDSPYRRVSH